MASGKKYWRLRYYKGGKHSWRTIGEYPPTGLQEARGRRDRRDELRKKLRDGEPLAAGSALFRDVALEWVGAHERKLTSEKYKNSVASRLDAHILPFIGGMEIGSIKTIDVFPLLGPPYETA
jgi:hypothetical protein